jgi:hypothetical protein
MEKHLKKSEKVEHSSNYFRNPFGSNWGDGVAESLESECKGL